MSRFTVQSAMVCRVNLFAKAMTEIYVVYPLEYNIFASTSHCLLLIAMTRIKLLRVLELMLQLNKVVHVVHACE